MAVAAYSLLSKSAKVPQRDRPFLPISLAEAFPLADDPLMIR